MNVSIKQLRAFLAVAQSHSFAEASGRIHLSQPALSITIRKLEQTVGGPLFARSTRRVVLTPEGESFYPVATRLLNDWTDAFEDLNERFLKNRGKVTLAALPTLAAGVLPPVIADFRARYPQISLSIHDVLAEQITQLIQEGRADIGFSVPPAASDDLLFEPAFEDQFVAVCPLGHPLLSHDTVNWADLAAYPFIGISRLSSSRQHIDRVMAQVGEKLDVLCDVSQIATVGRMVAAGIGISVLPALSFRQISAEGIDHRPLQQPSVTRGLGIITRRRHPLSAAATAMLSLVRESI